MVVGYSLGNRSESENEIQVLGEDENNVLTYSKALPIFLSGMSREIYPYIGTNKKRSLTVPYSTIKSTKQARTNGVREAYYVTGERPDKYTQIRSTLDLWGFGSYLDYLYTVCELGFLEGLIPVLDVGFLSPQEMKRLSEICALIKIVFEKTSSSGADEEGKKNFERKFDLQTKSLEWAGKLQIPTVSGIVVGQGETKKERKTYLERIAGVHRRHGTIHEVILQNFVPKPDSKKKQKQPPTKTLMLETAEMAMAILPDDISIIVPIALNPDIEDFIKGFDRTKGDKFSGGAHTRRKRTASARNRKRTTRKHRKRGKKTRKLRK